mmetsp:Transcript_26842/g.26759  ORF Transcript_26842/g.26759 Transcript_26842/m.26759 type:complete len:203 (-) Transcript_26842:495-1103(-)
MESKSNSSDTSNDSEEDHKKTRQMIYGKEEETNMESTDYSNLLEGAEALAQAIELARDPENSKSKTNSKEKESKGHKDDMTPPKKNNYMYMDESEGEDEDDDDNYGYPSKDDYFADLAEGEIVLDDDSDYPPYGEGEDEENENAIDQLKRFLHMKGEEQSPSKSKGSLKEEKKKVHPKTPQQKPTVKRSYREDEEKAPFTPL